MNQPRGDWCVIVSLIAVCFAIAYQPDTSHIPIWTSTDGQIDWIHFSADDRRCAIALSQPRFYAVVTWPDGTRTPARTSTIVVLDVRTRQVVWKIESLYSNLICFSPDAQLLAFQNELGFQVHDLRNKRCVLRWRNQRPWRSFGRMGFSADGNYLVMGPDPHPGMSDHTYQAWDLRTQTLATDFPQPSFWIAHRMARDGSKYFSGGWPGPTPRVVKFNPLTYLGACYRDPNIVFASFTRDSEHLLSIHQDGAIVLWQLKDRASGGIVPLKTKPNPGLEQARTYALLNASDRLAYADKAGNIYVRKLFHQ